MGAERDLETETMNGNHGCTASVTAQCNWAFNEILGRATSKSKKGWLWQWFVFLTYQVQLHQYVRAFVCLLWRFEFTVVGSLFSKVCLVCVLSELLACTVGLSQIMCACFHHSALFFRWSIRWMTVCWEWERDSQPSMSTGTVVVEGSWALSCLLLLGAGCKGASCICVVCRHCSPPLISTFSRAYRKKPKFKFWSCCIKKIK